MEMEKGAQHDKTDYIVVCFVKLILYMDLFICDKSMPSLPGHPL